MAPAVKGRAKAKSSSSTTKAANLKKPSAPTKTPSAISKVRKQKATVSKQTQVKTKRLSAKDALNKKKKRVYTAEELGVPQLNGIVPIGVEKPKGKKKGKVFVDDADSMMTILKIVEADKKGQIESKILRERQLEEVREARRKEQEGRYEEKKAKLEETKDSLRKRRKRKADDAALENAQAEADIRKAIAAKTGKAKKRVSFG